MEASNRQFGKELVDSVAKQFGYELDAVQVRDLMIVGDLKRVFTQVMSSEAGCNNQLIVGPLDPLMSFLRKYSMPRAEKRQLEATSLRQL